MSDDRQFAEWLPFLVNGTLPEPERAWMEKYLREHPQAGVELTFARRLNDYFKQPLADTAAEAGLASVLERLRHARRAMPPAVPFWKRWLATPAFAAVAAGLLLVQAGVIAYLLPAAAPQVESMYRSMPAGVQKQAMFKVIFRPSTEFAEILILLRKLEARIVAGPGPSGELWLANASVRSPGEFAEALKDSELVDDVTIQEP